MRSRGRNGTGNAVPAGLVAAGVFGAIHAGFSIYWSIGGTWLLSSLGSNLLARFQGWEWILAPIGLAKLIGALAPIALARKGWPVRLLTRSACWLGTLALIAWGGVSTVVRRGRCCWRPMGWPTRRSHGDARSTRTRCGARGPSSSRPARPGSG